MEQLHSKVQRTIFLVFLFEISKEENKAIKPNMEQVIEKKHVSIWDFIVLNS